MIHYFEEYLVKMKEIGVLFFVVHFHDVDPSLIAVIVSIDDRKMSHILRISIGFPKKTEGNKSIMRAYEIIHDNQ